MTIIEADLTWTGERFESGVRIAVDDDGMIAAVGSDLPATQRRRDRALLPGFVNVHSHAFQRGLRGRGETFPAGAGSFWTWREAMYGLVERMTPAMMYDLATQAFSEMRSAGITTVGEFHYLHHDEGGAGFALDEVVLKAAAEVGIRIILLNAFYKTGGVSGDGHAPLSGGQQRFATPDLDAYWAQMDALADAPGQPQLGVVAHSIRAVPLDDLIALHEESSRRGMVFHMHLEEQRQEIRDCVDRYGKPPMALVNEHLGVSPMFTAVHCTHTADADMAEFIASGGNICICPLTEANLGDGLPDLSYIHHKGGHVSIGTDSNSRLGMTEEMRWLEYAHRLKHERRGVATDDHGSAGRYLLDVATINGGRALGMKAGRIAEGYRADFTFIDLEAPALRGWTEDTLLDSIVFGSGNEAIAGTSVGSCRERPDDVQRGCSRSAAG